ncbi:MAG TPA: MerR family transcriptional regulator [Acidiferrobacterales bacterium]|jgi:DNA-binding transcriptional MerR regulator
MAGRRRDTAASHRGHPAARTAFAATVGRLARQAGVPAHVVRYYTRIGLLRPARDPGNGYKLFSEDHLRRLCFIRQARELGCTLREISRILRDAERGADRCPQVRAILARRLPDNRKRLRELAALQRRMERALEQWDRLPDGVPDSDSVDHLITSSAP